MKDRRSTTSDEIFERCLMLLIRPALRFCVRRSVKMQRILELMKVVLVQVAQEELGKKGESISRISAMTGVHRKDVARLLEGRVKDRQRSDLLTRVIGQWQVDKRFAKRPGSPKQLSVQGGEGTFPELVRSVSKELNPYTVLFELERLGLVSREEDTLSLRVREFAPQGDPEAGFQLLADDMEDLLKAGEQNTFRPDTGHQNPSPHLHLTTRYDNICLEYLPKIHAWFLKEGDALHRRARSFIAKFDKDINPKLAAHKGGGRIVLGMFSLTEEPSDHDAGDGLENSGETEGVKAIPKGRKKE